MSTFSIRLRELRQQAQLTQTEIGEKFGKTKSCFSSYEVRGRFPDEQMLKELASFFGVSVSYLLGETEIKNEIAEDKKTHSFTIDLVNRLLKENIIEDINNIPEEITDMIIASLKADLAKKKDTK